MAEPKSLVSFKTTPIKPTEKLLSLASNRPSTIDEDEPKWDMSAVKRHMKKEIGPYRHANVDLELFALHAWGITARQVSRLKKNVFTFPHKALRAYKTAKPENAMHAPFHTLAAYLLKETIKLLDPSVHDATTPAFWDYKGNKTLKQDGRQRKPDILILWEKAESLAKGENVWAAVKFILEFKNVLIAQEEPTPDPETPGPANPKQRPFKSENAAKVGQKRKHDGGCAASQKKKRVDKEELSDKYLQLTAYGLETMAATSRYWIIGLTLDKFRVTVCYMDRFHVIRASSFDFKQEPWKLALVLHGMNDSSARRAGHDPCLRTLPSSDCTSPGVLEGNQARPAKKVIGSYFEFPSAVAVFELEGFVPEDGGDPATDASDSEEPCDSKSDPASPSSSEGPSADTSQPEPPSTAGSVVLRIKGVIRRPDDLVGRGSTVYKVALRLPDGTYENQSIALKQSWVIAKRKSETDIIRAIKKRVPERARAHLPDVIFSVTSSAEDLGMPWVGMDLPLTEENHQVRVLRRIASRHYSPLWEAGSLKNFKKAFADCVQIHYIAYKLGKVLHRDISESNLMVDFSLGTVLGILNDWDMAKFVAEMNDLLTAAHHRTTSTPFLAIHRLSRTGLPHLYRFDLESFFYVLIWAAVHYNLKAGMRDTTVNRTLVPWTQGLRKNWNHKLSLMSAGGGIVMEEICNEVKPEFRPLKKEWIRSLYNYLVEVQSDYDYEVRKHIIPGDYKFDTLNDRFTFKSFMSAMGFTEGNAKEWAIIPEIFDL